MPKLTKKYKLIVFVPQDHVEQLRIAICNAGAGKVGNYEHCTFISSGIGTFKPLKGAKPFKGEIGKIKRLGEARLETIVPASKLKKVISVMKKVHPYEEVAYEVYKLEDF
jgi:hypothetical protein